MLVDFAKLSGAGNDFVIVDNRDGKLTPSVEQIVRVCHRQKGVGADGLILLENTVSGTDFAWSFFNSDGSRAEMCGNGARCFARFVQLHAGVNRSFTFQTVAGVIKAEFMGELIRVGLTKPHDLRLGTKLEWDGGGGEVHFLNTGVPHAILFVPDIESVPVQRWGAALRYHPNFAPEGTNVNFVQLGQPGKPLLLRTYERGVEGETLACGTGATASALVAALIHKLQSPVEIQVRSGDILKIDFQWNGEFQDVMLTGAATEVFTGKYDF